MDPLRLTLSRREARSPRLRLRVHVASVDSPGTLVAAVELPGSGGRERLSGVSVREPGWLTLDMGRRWATRARSSSACAPETALP